MGYPPVIPSDEEEERRKYAEAYPAVTSPSPAAATPAPSLAVTPRGGTADLESHIHGPSPAIMQPPAATTPRPQWSQYAPAEPHGWAKFGHIMAGINPTTNRIFNEMPEKRAEQKYKNAVTEYEAPAAEEAKQSETELRGAQAENQRSEARARDNPQPKQGLTPEETTIHDLMTGENGQPRINPQTGKPYSYLEAYQSIKQAGQDVKPDKVQTPEQQFIADEVKHGKTLEQAVRDYRDASQKSPQEPGSFMPLYDEKGHVTGAWDPKSGRIVKTPEGALPGNTSQGHGMEQKSEQQANATASVINSFTRYQKTFRTMSRQLTPDDIGALQVLATPQYKQGMADGLIGAVQSGISDTVLGKPLTGYSERLMGGVMTKQQFDKLTPAGQKMLADYSHAIVANFINMKNRMGTAGSRSREMVMAEMNNVPLPYIKAEAAEPLFNDTLEDARTFSGQGPQQQTQPERRVIDLTK